VNSPIFARDLRGSSPGALSLRGPDSGRPSSVIIEADRHGTVSAGTSPALSASNGPPPSTSAAGSVPSLRQERGRVEVRLPNLDALFDRSTPPSYPHRGPMVERSVARFLQDATREQRRRPDIEVVLALESPPLLTEAEAEARRTIQRFFANEAELAALDFRVNRADGLGSLQFSIPFVLVALLIAGAVYLQVGVVSGAGFLEALVYLVFITIVWVMLWDPIELLLFDSYLIRRRIRALQKLSRARVTFVYPTSPGP